MREEEEQELIDGPMSAPPSQRRIINGCYDDVGYVQPGTFTHLLKVLIVMIVYLSLMSCS